MLYYSHNRGGTVQWQSKATDFDSKASGTQRDLNKEERRRDIESDPSDESQCVVLKIKVTEPLAFCKNTHRKHHETNGTLVREEKKKVNRISRVHG